MIVYALVNDQCALCSSGCRTDPCTVMAGVMQPVERVKKHARAIGEAERPRAACESHNDDNCRSLVCSAGMTALEVLGSWKARDWMKRWGLNEGGWV